MLAIKLVVTEQYSIADDEMDTAIFVIFADGKQKHIILNGPPYQPNDLSRALIALGESFERQETPTEG